MKRVMCIYLPKWPLQRLWHVEPDIRSTPLAITRTDARGGAFVFMCCPRAHEAGIVSGMTVAEARAIARNLQVHEEDAARDLRALKKLAVWAERFSPIVGLEEGPEPQCLLVDVTGCAGCFHGEDRLARLAVRELARQGWDARAVIADTLGAAWALGHRADDILVIPAKETEPYIRPLPIALLRVPDEVLAVMLALGIDTIGQLLDLPRSDLPGRFGRIVLLRLDQILGNVPEIFVPWRPEMAPQANCTFEYPTERQDFLAHALGMLVEQIVEGLQKTQRGVKHLECWLQHEAVEPTFLELRLFQPALSLAHLKNLLRARLEETRVGDPVAGIVMRASRTETIREKQKKILSDDGYCPDELSRLIDQLVGRLGHDAVTCASLVPDPQPEFSFCYYPVSSLEKMRSEKNNASVNGALPFFHAPIRLWPAPAPIHVIARSATGMPVKFRCLGKEQEVVRWWRRERIETGWWRGCDVRRDYYMIETSCGARWWIYRSINDEGWFLHGCFG